MPDGDLALAVLALAAASYACRAGGFLLMRFVRITPRIEAALRAVPLAVMVGIVTPSAASGRLPELAALVAVAIAMKRSGNELIAALAGLAVVAGGRWAGM
ncbi:MAG: branched-chain amino acid ABC transporter [Burkholderiaceae bacterium]|nr:branched-chain amino acid ABC transporter [Burkholderiaceae bacterium]